MQIETIVNPIKSGMRTIKNMPDTLVGGIAKILLGRGPMKQSSFLDVMPAIEVKESVPSMCMCCLQNTQHSIGVAGHDIFYTAGAKVSIVACCFSLRSLCKDKTRARIECNVWEHS